MKRTVSICLIALLCVSLFVACSNDDTASTGTPDYLSWTGSDWEKASDDQKASATDAMLDMIANEMGQDASTLKEQRDTFTSLLNTYFSVSPDDTIKDYAQAIIDRT